MLRIRILLAALVLVAAVATAEAQNPLPADPVSSATTTFGALHTTPRFEILNVGFDSNVFNEPVNPKDDFTATFRPALDGVLRFGPGRLSFKTWLEGVYFHEYDSERSLNRFGELKAELRTSRFVPFASISGLDTNTRPNAEIDLRADRSVQGGAAGLAVAVLSRTALVVNARRDTLRYDEGQFFGGEDLAEQLNNVRETYEGGVRIALTALTTVSVLAVRETTRFDRSADRNSESLRIGPQIDFDPGALISGSAAVGYRQFTPDSPDLREFEGIVAQITLRYTQPSTAVQVRFSRDVDYSFQDDEPYYVATSGSVTVTQRVYGPLDLQGALARDRLAYEARAGAAAAPGSDDTTTTATVGIGYRLGEKTRLGLNLEFSERDSEQFARPYDRRRILTSLTHGF